MASKPPVRCPLCQSELDPTKDLEDHLVEEHSPGELAESIASDWEAIESGEATE